MTSVVEQTMEMVSIMQTEVCMFAAAALIYVLVSGVAKPARLKKGKVDEGPPVEKKSSPRCNNGNSKSKAVKQGCQASTEKDVVAAQKSHESKYAKMIRDFGKEGKLDAAIDAFASVKLGCSTMTSLSYNGLLDACVQCADMSMAMKYFAEVKEANLADVTSYNIMIKGYLAAGSVDVAKSVWTEMESAGLIASHVTYHSFLHASVQSGDRQGAFRWVTNMQGAGFKPTSVTCAILLKLVSERSPGADLSRILALVDECEAAIDDVLLTSLVEACIKTGRLDLLSERLRKSRVGGQLGKLSSPTYGAMIKAYGQAQKIDEVWAVWGDMRQSAIQPTVITVGCVVDALAANGAVDSAWQLVQELWEHENERVLINTVIYSTILKGFNITRRLDKMLAVYDEMKERGIQSNVITYNTMLNTLVRCGDLRRMPQLLEDMRNASPQVEPDLVTYSTIMKGYCSSGELEKGLELLATMEEDGRYAPDEVMFNSLLEGCAKQQRLEDALKLLEKMRGAKIAMSNYTLSIMIKLLGRSKRLSQAFDIVQNAVATHGIRLNIFVYTCLMQACFQNRQLQKAITVHDQCVNDGCLLDEKAYVALARGCLVAGNALKAAEVVRCAYGLSGHSLCQGKGSPPGVDEKCLQEVSKKLRTGGNAKVAEQLEADLAARKCGNQHSRGTQQSASAPWRRQ